MGRSPDKGEGELFYHVLSMGTFGRVAPEWMRDDMIFHVNVCSICLILDIYLIGFKFEHWKFGTNS